MDNNKENVVEQKSQRELSDASTVKTPLVDALRSYFEKTHLNYFPFCNIPIEITEDVV